MKDLRFALFFTVLVCFTSVSVAQTHVSTHTISACDSMVWRQHTYNQSGTYADTLTDLPHLYQINGSSHDSTLTPFNTAHRYCYTQMIYDNLQLPTCRIDTLWFYLTEAHGGLDSSLVVYLGHTTEHQAATNTSWQPIGNMQQVYNGAYQHDGTHTGWVPLVLQTPFNYDGHSNLVLATSARRSSTLSNEKYGYQSRYPGSVILDFSDSDPISADPTASPRTGLLSNALPALQISAQVPLGYDSIIRLQLTLGNSTSHTIYTAACALYQVGDFVHTASGNYIDTLHTSANPSCDSIVQLHLVINAPNLIDTSVTACDSYPWRSTTYTQSGIYYDYISLHTPVSIGAVGTGSNKTSLLPINNVANHSFSQIFYKANEIGVPQGGQIDTIWLYRTLDNSLYNKATYELANITLTDTLMRVYMAHTADSLARTKKQWVPQESLEEVFRGRWVQRATDTGWVAIPLTTPFYYNGFDNVALVFSNHTSNNQYDSRIQYRYTSAPNGTAMTRYGFNQYYYGEYPDTNRLTGSVERQTRKLNLRFSIRQGQCDSSFSLHLTVNQSTAHDTAVHAWDQYTWHGTNYNHSGTMVYRMTNAIGCDSTDTLHLSITHYQRDTLTDTACNNYSWRGHILTQSGLYRDTVYHYPLDSDTIYNLQLTLLHSTSNNSSQVACDNYTWILNTDTLLLSNSGMHIHTYINTEGCLSIDTLHLTLQSTHNDTTAAGCNSFIWVNQGQTFSFDTTGVYVNHYTNELSCPSADTLHLSVFYSTYGETIDSACNSYQWNDHGYARLLDSTGIYYNNYTNEHGCSSTQTLYLNIFQGSHNDTSVTTCTDFSWANHGDTMLITRSGVFTHNYADIHGCASTDTLHLIHHGFRNDTLASACNTFVWLTHGDTLQFSASGAYVHHYNNIYDCPSTDSLFLTIYNSSYNDTTAESCDTYTWYDKGNVMELDTTGVYVSTYQDDNHCFSVDTLHLTIFHSSSTYQSDTACDSYTWNGHVYTMSANDIQFDTVNALGCDSTVHLDLTLHYSSESLSVYEVCDSLVWHGSTYTYSTNNALFDTLNSYGCDSVARMHVTVHYSTGSELEITSGSMFYWHGTTYTTSGNYIQHLTTQEGCDSTVVLHLTVLPIDNGSLPGLFSVSPTLQVYISQGNLQYLASEDTWRFASQQYETVGDDNTRASSFASTWIDLFGWGTSNYHNSRDAFNVNYHPWSISIAPVNSQYNSHGYGPSTNMDETDLTGTNEAYDWGMNNPISNGGNQAGHWRTLTYPEWHYLLLDRTDASNKIGMAAVAGVKGIILIPDTWEQPGDVPTFYPGIAVNQQLPTANTYNIGQWLIMQASGAAFLPVAGNRFGRNLSAQDEYGYYWSATHDDSQNAYLLAILDNSMVLDGYFRYIGRSVRLVQDYSPNGLPCRTIGDTVVRTTSEYWWHDNLYSQSGDYALTLLGANTQGCDSTVTLHLTIGTKSIGTASLAEKAIISTEAGYILVAQADNQPVYVYDALGRLVGYADRSHETVVKIKTPAMGVFMVKVGNAPARKVVVRY